MSLEPVRDAKVEKSSGQTDQRRYGGTPFIHGLKEIADLNREACESEKNFKRAAHGSFTSLSTPKIRRVRDSHSHDPLHDLCSDKVALRSNA